MIKSYLKTAWRNLLRNRVFSIINLAGLSVSVAFCLLLFYHIRWEQGFDAFHSNKDRLYRCEMSQLFPDMDKKPAKGFWGSLLGDADVDNNLAFPIIAGPDLQHNFPEVSAINRLRTQDDELVKAAGSVYKETHVVRADDNFFQVFSFPLIRGDARTVLSSPQNVVLSETVAKKYFGDKEPIGQTISLVNDSSRLYRVSGIAKDAPANSSISVGLVFPIKGDPDYAEHVRQGFNQMAYQLVVELRPGTDGQVFEKKMNTWVGTYIKPYMDTGWYKSYPASVRDAYHWNLRPFADCHYNVSAPWGHYTNARAIYQLLCVVAVILLLASLNYVLITVSNAAGRSQEVGVRKVMGAGRRSIVLQSWVETQLIAGIAVGVGLLLSWMGLPLLRSTLGSGVSFGVLSWKEMLGAALVLAFLLGILAGYYPALLISRLKPVSIMKSFSSVRINPRFSRILVVVQFTCCVVLMTAAFVIDRQMAFVMNKDLGFDKDQVLIIDNPSWDRHFTAQTRDGLYAFARNHPDVLGFSAMGGDLTGGYNTNGFKLNGKQEWRKELLVDYDFFQLLKLKLVQGRAFSRDFSDDTAKKAPAVVVNETLFNMLGKEAKVGVYNKDIRGTIIGVVKDYNFESVTRKIEPEEHRLGTRWLGHFFFKVRAGKMPATIRAFEAEWKKMTNNYPFSYSFLDASLAQMYEADMRWQRAMKGASFFAIVIACMGLFGLSAIAAVNRTREIGIRKVLGANVRQLVTLLAAGFLSMVALSIVIAVPLGWWLMNKWLEDFAYRIEIRWWMFAVVGLTAVVIALATVSVQVLRAARANPVEALRSE
jgi:putative ABC transport system permease protein